jgi:F420-non-reducing hydrogenase iron-sulfur subunit
LLNYVGINPDRVLLDWVSASEANRFAEVVQEFTEWVRHMGPLETKEVA